MKIRYYWIVGICWQLNALAACKSDVASAVYRIAVRDTVPTIDICNPENITVDDFNAWIAYYCSSTTTPRGNLSRAKIDNIATKILSYVEKSAINLDAARLKELRNRVTASTRHKEYDQLRKWKKKAAVDGFLDNVDGALEGTIVNPLLEQDALLKGDALLSLVNARRRYRKRTMEVASLDSSMYNTFTSSQQFEEEMIRIVQFTIGHSGGHHYKAYQHLQKLEQYMHVHKPSIKLEVMVQVQDCKERYNRNFSKKPRKR